MHLLTLSKKPISIYKRYGIKTLPLFNFSVTYQKENKMIRKLFLNLSLLLVVTTFNSGCAINRATSTVNPTANLDGMKSIYVNEFASDVFGINLLIANKLKKMGYLVNTGVDTPPNVDVVVTYKDKWMWDLTSYLIELTITIRDPKTNFPLASGNSYHTSLTRKSPEEMVDEVIDNIFK
jgi:hypothetical protein